MKKTLILLSVFILFTCSSVFADEQAAVSVKQGESDTGGNIAVLISISDNSNLCGGSFNLVYDNTKLKAVSYEQSDLLSLYTSFINSQYGDNTVRFSWAGTESLTSGGKLFTISFSPIVNSSFETDITIDKLKLADNDGNKINASAENGKITYTASTPSSREHKSSGNTSLPNDKPADNTNINSNKTSSAFSDVSETDWFYSWVMAAYENGLMQGISESEFNPGGNLTRAMFITVMHRISDWARSEQAAPFTDVPSDEWYSEAVAWGYENGIISGISETEFAPNAGITREQIAAILYRYAKYKGVNTDNIANEFDMSTFPDKAQISEWAFDAMRYCISQKVINGDDAGNILPQNYASRAEMSTMIVRFIKL